MIQKILIFTGTRAEYGLLSGLIQILKKDPKYQIELLVSGTHLSEKFGFSYKEIESDGHKIRFKVDIEIDRDDVMAASRSMSLGLIGYSDVLKNYKPDLAIVLGDRYEAFSFAISCQLMQVPLAHIHGGEITEGAIDDAFRHSITKLSQLHFTSAEEHKLRVLRLGEQPDRVFNVGALGVDNAIYLKKMSREDLENDLHFKMNQTNYLVTFHPETLAHQSIEDQLEQFLMGLQTQINKDTLFIFTMPNSDPGHQVIFDKIQRFQNDYQGENKNSVIFFSTLGRLRYLSLMQLCDGVIGNSSSGLIEAPALNVMTLNIGDRQKGRLHGKSVIHANCTRPEIVQGFETLKKKISPIESVYGDGQAAVRIKKSIDQKLQNSISVRKSFYD
jgi:GDP/UDP-N,N'-diacetylbacillosamine 2-epimerase (hydrolysing)